ncbi:LysR substrate-binding domain-containing protein [Sphingomonas sp. MMS24-JH45]
MRFDLQTVHHDDLLRKLYERETDIAVVSEPPHGAPLAHTWLGEGELVVLYREEDMPDAPARVELRSSPGGRSCRWRRAQIGTLLADEIERLDLVLDEVASARTSYIAAALARAGVGMAVVDSFTAEAWVSPGLSARPLKPSLAFDVHAIHLVDRPPSALASEFLGVLADVIEGR